MARPIRRKIDLIYLGFPAPRSFRVPSGTRGGSGAGDENGTVRGQVRTCVIFSRFVSRSAVRLGFLAISALIGAAGCGLLIDGDYGAATLATAEAGVCLTQCPEGACGKIDDQCSGTLSCKPCVVACTPKTCPDIGTECGVVDDGCGHALDCGKCTQANAACTAGKCECKPKSCTDQGANCGTIGDGCGGAYTCGTCAAPTPYCGGAGLNKCGSTQCVPKTCLQLGLNCGTISDGCGTLLDCGTCAAPAVCGGGGSANVCSCVPKTCAQLGKNCGTVDNCGEPLSCGTCTNPYQTCGGNGTPNVCGCKPKPQAQACVGRCIFAPDGCGGNINCPFFCSIGSCNQATGTCT